MEQDKLIPIYNELKKILKKYEDPLEPKFDLDSKYDLWSFKTVEIDGRKKKEVYFAGLVIQSSYVGFYYMPIYTDRQPLEDVFGADLLNTLKGKSCFHIKKLDSILKKQIEDALEAGFELYKERGWV